MGDGMQSKGAKDSGATKSDNEHEAVTSTRAASRDRAWAAKRIGASLKAWRSASDHGDAQVAPDSGQNSTNETVVHRMPKWKGDEGEEQVDPGTGKDRRKPGSLGKFKGTDALRAENKVVRDVAVKLGLSDDEATQLHDAVSGKGLDYKGILKEGIALFPKKAAAKGIRE